MLRKGFEVGQAAKGFANIGEVVERLQPSYPVHCLRPDMLDERARHFLKIFPGRVLYALKCNPNPRVVSILYEAGVRHFDAASLPEIAQVAESMEDATSYFMHPVKSRAVIRTAYQVYGVRHFVVDHEDELEKVLTETKGEGITILVRLTTPPEDSLYHLSDKFGASADQAIDLLKTIEKRGCATGIAFHVGSQCCRPKAYSRALVLVGQVIEGAGITPRLVDVGGGFPSSYVNQKAPPLEAFMAEIRSGLAQIDLGPEVAVLSEPGRALVSDSCSVLTQVQLRKENQLYINDGIYGSLSEMVTAKLELPARALRLDGCLAEETERFILNGPTCDSLDVLPPAFELPKDIREGDWIEIGSIGAYSLANATHFNGFHPDTMVEVFDRPPQIRG